MSAGAVLLGTSLVCLGSVGLLAYNQLPPLRDYGEVSLVTSKVTLSTGLLRPKEVVADRTAMLYILQTVHAERVQIAGPHAKETAEETSSVGTCACSWPCN